MPHLVPFFAVAAVLVVMPGPDMALVTKNALQHGRRAALLTALGINVGLLGWTIAAALGIATVIRASVAAFDALRIAGTIYLVVMGLRTLLATRRVRGQEPGEFVRRGAPSDRAAVRQGVFCNLLNPKIAVFFTSFLPQFVAPAHAALPQLLLLGLLYIALTLAWLVWYAGVAARTGGLLHRPRVRTALQRVTGGVLIAFGLRLATEGR